MVRNTRLLMGSTATALLATTLLAGCGGDTKAPAPIGPTLPPTLQGDPTQVVAAAAGRSLSSPNADLTVTIPVVQEGELTAVVGEGSIDFRADKLKLVPPAAEKAEERKIGRSLFVLLPEQAVPQLGGKKWLMLDLDQVGAKSPDPYNLYAYDPEQLLKTVTAVQDASVVGPEQVRDITTTHFRGTLDPAKVTSAGLDPTFARQWTTATKGAVTPVDVWLDDAGLVRRVTTDLPPPETALPAGAKPETTVELHGYGAADVRFAPPPVNEITQLSALSNLEAEAGD